jgi:hypothetical protein
VSDTLRYRVSWRSADPRPGAHASQHRGSGSAFSQHAGLLEAPDPRRFDLHATLRDPLGRLRFRVYRQSGVVPLVIVADLSASMDFRGCGSRRELLADFCEALGEAAWQTGDPFGFYGCDLAPLPAFVQPPRLQRGLGPALAARLRAFTPSGRGAEGLLQAPALLGRRRALVFLVSDFHLKDELLNRLLAALGRHDLVPVVCWDEAEYRDLPRFGWARVRDPESGRERGLLLRPGLHRAIRDGFAERRRRLEALLRRHGRRPLYLDGNFRAATVTRFFYG